MNNNENNQNGYYNPNTNNNSQPMNQNNFNNNGQPMNQNNFNNNGQPMNQNNFNNNGQPINNNKNNNSLKKIIIIVGAVIVLLIIIKLLSDSSSTSSPSDYSHLPEGSKSSYDTVCETEQSADNVKYKVYVGLKESTSATSIDYLYIFDKKNIKDENIDTAVESLCSNMVQKGKYSIENDKIYITCQTFKITGKQDLINQFKNQKFKCK